MLFEEERFQIGFEGGETWSITQRFGGGGGGREFQVTGPVYEKAGFPYLLSLMRGTVMRPASAERREREG